MATPRKIECKVERLIDHGDHVYTLDLKPSVKVPKFTPGQFLHLALDPYDPTTFWPESRVFSIASAPSDREMIRISYSKQGAFTARMENELSEGSAVWIKLPYGDFVVANDRDVVLFAGGTGLTAYTAFLEGLGADFEHEVVLAYGARTDALLIYKDRILERAATVPRLKARLYTESGLPEIPSLANVVGKSGMLSVEDVLADLAQPRARDYYISGPPAMIEAINQQLADAGIGEASIHIDAWE